MRELGGKCCRDGAAPGVTDDNDSGPAEGVECGRKVRRDCRQGIPRLRLLRVTVPALVQSEQRHAIELCDHEVPEPALR